MLELSPTTPISTAARQPIPLTKGWPLVGSLPALLKDPFGFFMQARETYGDMYWLNLGLSRALVLNHPQHAQHTLRDQAHNYRKGGPMWDAIRTLLGNGLVVSEGDLWLRQRRMLQPQFHRQRLAALTDLMVDAIDETLAAWQEAAEAGTPFNIAPAFNHVTMRVIVRTLFGSALSEREMDEVAASMTYALDYLLRAMVTNVLPQWLPLPGKRRYRQALAQFDQVIYRLIDACRRGETPQNHLLAMLLDTVDEETGQHMSDQQLRDEVATLFLAGYETTSIALSWAFHYLTQQPELLTRLQDEVDSVLAGRRPTFADLPQLPFTRMALQETMRLCPPAWWLPRTALAEDEIDGHTVPAGTNIITLIYMIHRHPSAWPDAERFDPERFATEATAGRHRFAWVPFGAGQRLCLGRDFSLMEGQLALAMVAQRFNLRAVPGQVAQPQLTTTLRPKNGVILHLQPRQA